VAFPRGPSVAGIVWTPVTFTQAGGAVPALLAGPLLVLAMVLLLFTLPVTLPVVALLHKRDRARLRTAASRTQCVRCGHMLGPAALDAADAAEMEAMAALRRQHPYDRMRIVRRSDARCVICGTDYRWDERRRELHLVPGRSSSE